MFLWSKLGFTAVTWLNKTAVFLWAYSIAVHGIVTRHWLLASLEIRFLTSCFPAPPTAAVSNRVKMVSHWWRCSIVTFRWTAVHWRHQYYYSTEYSRWYLCRWSVQVCLCRTVSICRTAWLPPPRGCVWAESARGWRGGWSAAGGLGGGGQRGRKINAMKLLN